MEAERDQLTAERDRLVEQITARQRSDVEALAGDRLVDGADVWSGGVELAHLLDDDGDIDTAKLTEAIDALVQAKPHYRVPPTPRPDPSQGARGSTAPAAAVFADVLRARRR